jgi:hypothetical protein
MGSVEVVRLRGPLEGSPIGDPLYGIVPQGSKVGVPLWSPLGDCPQWGSPVPRRWSPVGGPL